VNSLAIVLVLTCLVNIFLGLFVLLRNTHSRAGQSFFATTILIDCWGISNYFTDYASSLDLSSLFNRLAYLFAFLAIVAAATFTSYFTNRVKRRPRSNIVLAVFGALIICILSVTSFVAGTVIKHNGQLVFTTGKLIIFYDLVILALLASIIWDLYQMAKKGTANQRSQANIILAGFTISILIGLLTNAILPSITDNFHSTKYGPPILSFLVVFSISYAIIRHKLFDIRAFVIRTAAYSLTFLVAALIYVIPTVLLTSYLLNAPLSKETLLILSLITLITALLFQPLRIRFNKATNRLFFRDYYDPQDFLDKLTNLLVGSVDVKVIENGVSRIIKSTIRPAQVTYLLEAGDKTTEERHLLNVLSRLRSDQILFDELDPKEDSTIYNLFSANDIALSAKLRTNNQSLGYVLLGFKRSGAAYSEMDRRVINIAADEIAIGLENALRFEEIRQFNITLQEKIDEATKKLRHANARLKELDATKDEFISMASHQLRTPLTTIKGYLSMILDGDVGKVKKEEKELVQHAFDSAQRMVYLISDLLNVSRLQTGKFVIENSPTDLAKVVDGEVTQLGEQAATRKIMLAYDKPKEFPILNMDETKIRQVIMNFLDNALYYTPPGGKVTAKLEATPDSVIYTVADTGVGVPASLQHHLFTKFYRADNARRMRPDGTGLGLYMAKKVIVAQGGAVIFKSTEGKGSTFGFSFPRKGMEAKK
jgi:signal transduction histidine kinase